LGWVGVESVRALIKGQARLSNIQKFCILSPSKAILGRTESSYGTTKAEPMTTHLAGTTLRSSFRSTDGWRSSLLGMRKPHPSMILGRRSGSRSTPSGLVLTLPWHWRHGGRDDGLGRLHRCKPPASTHDSGQHQPCPPRGRSCNCGPATAPRRTLATGTPLHQGLG
jgi:hypothetical protein